MRKVFNKELLEIAKKDPRVFMILADIGYGEIEEFANTFPDRFINNINYIQNILILFKGIQTVSFIGF